MAVLALSFFIFFIYLVWNVFSTATIRKWQRTSPLMWRIQMRGLVSWSVCLQLHAHYCPCCLCLSLPGSRLSPGLRFDHADSRQGKNSSSHLKRCAMDINRCVQRRSCHSQHQQRHHRCYRPVSDLIIRCWGCTRDLSANTSFHLLADACFICATKTHKKNTQTSLVPCFTTGLW